MQVVEGDKNDGVEIWGDVRFLSSGFGRGEAGKLEMSIYETELDISQQPGIFTMWEHYDSEPHYHVDATPISL